MPHAKKKRNAKNHGNFLDIIPILLYFEALIMIFILRTGFETKHH